MSLWLVMWGEFFGQLRAFLHADAGVPGLALWSGRAARGCALAWCRLQGTGCRCCDAAGVLLWHLTVLWRQVARFA